MTSFAGKRILVVGLGVSGFAAARRLAALEAKVRVTESGSGGTLDERATTLASEGVEVETGGHDLDRLDVDLAVVSPGIPPSAAVMRALVDRHIEIISEVELAFLLADRDYLAVTGTNGKTTTTALLAAMLDAAGIASVAAGNIGLPLVDAVAMVPDGGAIALEVSSFQLHYIKSFRPRIAVLLNVAEDHTDWHGSVQNYADAKARMVLNQSGDDVFLPNYDDPRAMAVADAAGGRVVPFSARRVPPDGIGVRSGMIVWKETEVASLGDVPLPGSAGIEDAVAAAGAALEYGIDARAVRRALAAFRPLAHRLELVADGAVRYIDDSKATNPHATVAAVQGLTDVVLIAGGRSKGIDLSELARTVPPVVAVVAIGESADDIDRVFEPLVPVEHSTSMDDAVVRATRLSRPGGSVLLSPGCASLDMYTSYAERGEAFARAVRSVMGDNEGAPTDGNS